jgi:glutamyl-tRNA reductase
MSLLVVGVSHRTAPVPLLEQVALTEDAVPKLLHDLAGSEHLNEVLVLSTCNRVEVYADVGKFHAGVQHISEGVCRASQAPLEELTGHFYVHYEGRVVQHMFTVACGLDSMVVGETQILGQLRQALAVARQEGTAGRTLTSLVQHALRVGKQVHTETGLAQAGQSLVSVGLRMAEQRLGALTDRPAMVVGAGSMSALAAAALRRLGVGPLTVVNRNPERARALLRDGDRVLGFGDLAGALTGVDLAVCCTGAAGIVVDEGAVAAAVRGRGGRPLFLLDLALPRDVDPVVRRLPGVSLTDLEDLSGVLAGESTGRDVDAAHAIVADRVGQFLAWQSAMRVAPTVAALRSKAADVVEAELRRLAARVPELDPRVRGEVEHAVQRVVDKLLHAPTVRVKQLAGRPDGDAYAAALRELFELDPAAPAVLARADVVLEEAVPADGVE